MHAIRIRRKLESANPHLPELQSLVGKTIEMIVWEEGVSCIIPGTGDWLAVEAALGSLDGYDFDAWREQRAFDLRHAADHVP